MSNASFLRPPIAVIVGAVCDETGEASAEVLGPRRHSSIARARHLAIYISMDVFGYSSTDVGIVMSRDHTTALHGRDSIRDAVAQDPELAIQIDRVAEVARRIHAARRNAEQAAAASCGDAQ